MDDVGRGDAANPWKTIYYAYQQVSPGDTIYLEPGATFRESVYIAPERSGAAGAPVTLTSDSNNRPVISPPDTGGHAINVWNAGNLRFENLRVVWPSGLGANYKAGLNFYATNGPGSLHFENVEVTGFNSNGVCIGSWAGADTGYNGVTVLNCRFHANENAGFFIYGDKKNSHRNLVVRDSHSHDNWRGDGFLINGVTNGLVERSVAYNNGTYAGGRIGFWTYGVDGIVIQYNESYNNRTTPGGKDGGGFDFDGGTVNSILQYNYSHGNDGAGYGVYQYKGAAAEYGPLENNIIRYNLSVNDGRRDSYGALAFWGDSATDFVGPNEIYHNTIHVGGGNVTSGSPSAVRFQGSRMSGLRIRNNNFIVANGYRLIDADSAITTTHALFQGNNWWAMPGTNFQLRFGTTTYTSLAAWRTATGNERLDGVDVGTSVDPRLVSPGSLVASDYALRADSPMIDGALDFTGRGDRDYFGNSLPQGNNHDVGAHDRRSTVTINATQSEAAEFTGAPAVFNVARTGSTIKALTVPVTLGGTAHAGADYPAQAAQVTLPAGVSGVTISLVPVKDDLAEGMETVSASTGNSSLFDAGAAGAATILDTPADDWRFERFGSQANTPGIADDRADPDGDGLPNLIEYALGRNPQQPSSALPGPDATDGRISLRVLKNSAAIDLDWSAEVTGNLTEGSWTGNVTILQNDATAFEARDNITSTPANPRFMRLRVTRQASGP